MLDRLHGNAACVRGRITHGIVTDVDGALALTGSGDMIWDWDVSSDKVFTSPETEVLLGLKRGTLEGSAARWLEVLHPLDRDRFRAALDSVLEQRRGRLTQDFRLRAPDGHYLWFALKARPGCVVPWHYHTAAEQLIVVHGQVLTEMEGMPATSLGPGGFASMLSREKHQFTCTGSGECLLFVTFDRTYDIHWVSPRK